jgi:hypothetical protein
MKKIEENNPVVVYLRKRFETYSDEELQIFNGDNKETLEHWNRTEAIEEAIINMLDEID